MKYVQLALILGSFLLLRQNQIWLAVACVVLALLAGFIVTKRRTPAEFWEWFMDNEERFFKIEENLNARLSELNTELGRVNSKLCVEPSPVRDGRRELVIGPGGIKEAFPIAAAVVEAAPSMERWIPVKYKQRHLIGPIIYEGVPCDPEDVRFTMTPEDKKLDIRLYMKGYEGPRHFPRYGQVAFVMLDGALGEYDVAFGIGGVAIEPFERAPATAKPFRELPTEFDAQIGPLRALQHSE